MVLKDPIICDDISQSRNAGRSTYSSNGALYPEQSDEMIENDVSFHCHYIEH